ncbi:hypothetical protein [Anoxynatronum sibiricum]|uniref:Uncharacterized protein n=1 Tax=Anoxynatronum sibiricum TaxID=210623 RepID=A0ABU9VWC5_9CLOT
MARPRIKTSTDVLRILNRLVVAVEKDEMELDKARVLIYAASTAGAILKNIEIESRLDTLEKAAEQATGGNLKAVR